MNKWVLIFAATLSANAQAFQFQAMQGELQGSFDTTLSLGFAWRVQERDPALVGIANGGTARSVNEDDGNLNYDKNDLTAAMAKATHELELKYRNFGAFFRATYFYDFENHDRAGLGPVARERVGRDFRWLDAYVSGKFDIGGKTLRVRAGDQVLSWGESTFIPNGINIINPVELSVLRVPGAELREALIPSTMLWASQELSDSFSVEGFVLTNFDKTRIDPKGTYFSNNDFISDDADRVFAGFGRRRDLHQPLINPATDPTGTAQVWAPRIADRNPKDSGQYGIALRYLASALNDTEFGLYHINYHSRIPLASAIKGVTTSLANPTGAPVQARYFAEYPEDIRLWGLSFNTAGPAGIALQGEYSYRPNLPLQIATPDLLLAALGAPNIITGFTPLPAPAPPGATTAALVPNGTEIQGWRRVKMSQLQMTATKAFGPTWGAEQLVVLGEAGMNKFHNLPADLKFNAPAVFLPATQAGANATAFGSVQPGGFLTEFSWGYRVLARLDFPNALGPATVSPRLAFSHDVKGTGPNFNEGVKALTLGIGFNYKQNWQADIFYTNYFGGRTYSGVDTPPAAGPNPFTAGGQPTSFASSANPLKDRDFIAVTVSYSF